MELDTNIKWGIYLGLSVSLATQILTWFGLGLTNWFVFVTYLLVVLCIAWVCNMLKKKNGNQLKFSTALISVLIIVIISRFIFQGYMWVYTRYADPEWVNQVSLIWTDILKEENTPSDKIDQQIQAFIKSYETLPMFTIEVFKYAIPQLVLGVVTSLFFVLRKGKTEIS